MNMEIAANSNGGKMTERQKDIEAAAFKSAQESLPLHIIEQFKPEGYEHYYTVLATGNLDKHGITTVWTFNAFTLGLSDRSSYSSRRLAQEEFDKRIKS